MKTLGKISGIFAMLTSLVVLSGCDLALLNPAGPVARDERNLIVIATLVMLCVVIPVMIAVVCFAIKYRAANTESEYLPDWGHSNKIEAFMWGIPICIVTILAILTAYYTFKREPSKPLGISEVPLQVDVVALDWKWLFIYPQYGVASVNELYAPEGREVFLQLTAENSINAFWVPKLGTILYAMPQMNAKLHLLADEQGVFPGVSANYSGDGFAGMNFQWHSVAEGDFDAWIAKLRESGQSLDRASYLALTEKSKNHPVEYFSQVEDRLYYRVANRCVKDGEVCNDQWMRKAANATMWGAICSVFDEGDV